MMKKLFHYKYAITNTRRAQMKERFFEYYIVQEKHPKTGKWKDVSKWFNTLDDAKAQIECDKIDYPNHPFFFNYDKGEVPEVRIVYRVTYDEIAEIIEY